MKRKTAQALPKKPKTVWILTYSARRDDTNLLIAAGTEQFSTIEEAQAAMNERMAGCRVYGLFWWFSAIRPEER